MIFGIRSNFSEVMIFACLAALANKRQLRTQRLCLAQYHFSAVRQAHHPLFQSRPKRQCDGITLFRQGLFHFSKFLQFRVVVPAARSQK